MFNLTLFFAVLYYPIYMNVDCVFVTNKRTNQHLSLLSQNNFNNTRLVKNKLLFTNNYNTNVCNYPLNNEVQNKYNKFQCLYHRYEDSIRNPAHNNLKFILSSLNDCLVETINCSGSETLPDPNFPIPYDQIHTCSFDGYESLTDIISTLIEPLRQRCQRIHFDHKALKIGAGPIGFEATSFRSIKALTYWIGARILNIARSARNSFDSRGLIPPEESINERKKCDEAIRKLVNDNLDKWNSNVSLEAYSLNSYYPDFKPDCVDKYVSGVWRYFNGRVFRNLLPDFWEVNYGWFDLLDENYRNILTESGEVFMFEKINYMDFPKFMYPSQLKSSPSALSNCVFRSMVKLFCDTYSAFDDFEYIDIVMNAFKFIESNSAEEEGVNFTVIQKSYESLVNYDSEKISLFNSKNMFAKEYDLNDHDALLLDTKNLPYIKNNFHFLSIYDGNLDSTLKLYEDSFKKDNEHLSRRIWFQNDKIIIPTTEISKTLLNSDLDGLSHIVALALNDLMKLKPLQLNFVQNRMVSLCIKFINSLRSLEAYSLNYTLEQSVSSMNKTVERLNLPLVQSVLFIMSAHEKCVTNNNLYPLSNDFIRGNQLEALLDLENISKKRDSNIYETNVYNNFLNQKEQEPVKFIHEYLDDSVDSDDQDALRFLVNYYNFNLFSGRLPIDIKVKFKYMDYLSSNDVSSVVTTPTIYINPLFKNSKKLICRLVLNECINIFLKWSNKFVYRQSSEVSSLNDIMEYNMKFRIQNHILNCSESSLSWPFYLDDLLLSDGHTYSKKDMYKMFTESFEKHDVVQVLEDFIKRENVSDTWNQKKLPIRDFICSLFSGVYDLSYSILANPASIQVTSKLNLTDLNYLENKFKHICEEYFKLMEVNNGVLASVLYLESLSIVESAFEELREQCIKNALIYTNDLVESISNVTNILTNDIQVKNEDTRITLDQEAHVCSTTSTSPELDFNTNFIGEPEKITNEEAEHIAILLYLKYNKFLFHEFLPDVDIKFEDIDELSDLKIDLTDFSRPVILINKYIDDVNLLNSQLVVQMVYLAHYYFRHVTSVDFLNQFGLEFKSAFNVVHNTRTNFLKSKLIPVNLERKIDSTRGKKTHNKEYVEFLNKTLDYKHNDLVTLKVNDLVYEVLEGREKFNHDEKLSNYYESLQTLKAFAYHYFNSLSYSSNSAKNLISESFNKDTEAKNGNDVVDGLNKGDDNSVSDSQNVKDGNNLESTPPSMESILEMFSPAMMKNGWISNMFDHVQKKLSNKGIGIFLQPPSTEWHSRLTERQQELVVDYISRHPDATLFQLLTKSNALTKREAVDLVTQCIHSDPLFKEKSITSAFSTTTKDPGPATTTPTVEIIKDDGDEVKPSKKVYVDDVEQYFNEEMATILDQLPPRDHDTFILFFHKLLDKDFGTCRNVLNSHGSPSFLVDKSVEMLQSIVSNNIIDHNTYEEIKQFLHK